MSNDLHLGEIEARFAAIIWDKEPLTSRELAILAEAELGWKKSTSYTVLRRLCERGLFQNEGGCVTSRIRREEFRAAQSEQFVEDTFRGSLPAFLTAFSHRRRYSEREIEAMKKILDSMREEET